MAETISSISVRLDADTAEYIRALKDAQRDTQKRLARIQKEFSATQKAIQRSSNVINAAIGGIVAGLSVNIFASIISDTTELVAEQQRLAAQLNITTDELRSYEYVGKFLGKSGEQMADVFKEVNERFEDASRGAGEASELLKELNLSVSDFIGLKPDEQYARLATELDKLDFNTAAYWADKFGDQLYETYLVQRNLGVNVAELKREYDDLFGLDSSELDKQMRQNQKSLIQIEEIWNRFKISFTSAIAPTLNDLLEQAVEYLKQLGDGNVSVGIINATNQMITQFENGLNAFLRVVEGVANVFANVYNSLVRRGIIGGDYIGDAAQSQEAIAAKDAEVEAQKRVVAELERQEKAQLRIAQNNQGSEKDVKKLNIIRAQGVKEDEKLNELLIERGKLLREQNNANISLGTVDLGRVGGGDSSSAEDDTGYNPLPAVPEIGATAGEGDPWQQFIADRQAQLEILETFRDEELLSDEEFLQERNKLFDSYGIDLTDSEKERNEQRVEAWKLSQEQIANVLSQAGNSLLSYSQSLAGASGEEKEELKKRFLQNQAFAIAQAGVNYFAQLASIYLTAAELGITGPFWEAQEVVRATTNYAATTAGIAGTALIGGAFHGGVDSVPASLNNKSFLLKEGERVVQPEANKMLTNFLENQESGQNVGGGGGVTISAPVHIAGNVTDEAWFTTQLMKQRNVIYAAQKKSERENPTKRRR